MTHPNPAAEALAPMSKAELQAKWPTFKIREEPTPECTTCNGVGERPTKVERHPVVPCWCVIFSREFADDAKDLMRGIGRKGLQELKETP